ncbi:hypothetical protein [Haloglycomyces albus]|uniref:hypothetical protein n=1 Tax=Haloglycomyces albus TaxID=526067 RepID=UPI00046D48EB|nr:hypothetical protein [Haloglycomyces albus]
MTYEHNQAARPPRPPEETSEPIPRQEPPESYRFAERRRPEPGPNERADEVGEAAAHREQAGTDTPEAPPVPEYGDVAATPQPSPRARGPQMPRRYEGHQETTAPESMSPPGPTPAGEAEFAGPAPVTPEVPGPAAESPTPAPSRRPRPASRSGEPLASQTPAPPAPTPSPEVNTVPPPPEPPPAHPTPPHTTDEEYEEREALLSRVREVVGVRDAYYVTARDGSPSLRLDLEEGVDPAEIQDQVSAVVAEQMEPPEADDSEAADEREPEQVSEPVDSAQPVSDDDVSPAPEPVSSVPPVPEEPVAPAEPSRPRRGAEDLSQRSEPSIPQAQHRSDSEPSVVTRPDSDADTEATFVGRGRAIPTVPVKEALPPALSLPEEPNEVLSIGLNRLTVDSEELTAEVLVDFNVGAEEARGRATAAASDWHVQRACATASLEALRPWLVPDGARVEIEHVSLLDTAPVQTAVVTLLWMDSDGPRRLAGAHVVDGEQMRAVVFAAVGALTQKMTH